MVKIDGLGMGDAEHHRSTAALPRRNTASGMAGSWFPTQHDWQAGRCDHSCGRSDVLRQAMAFESVAGKQHNVCIYRAS
jgi:hypothetical protein